MYRRYNPQQSPPGNRHSPQNTKPNHPKNNPQSMGQKKQSQNHNPKSEPSQNKADKEHPLTKFIPQSVYDPKSGKILGFLSAEDLLIIALILLMIDSDDGETDNSMLVYALIYILLSEHMDLPF